MDDQPLTAEPLDSVSRRRLLGLIGAGAAGTAIAVLSADTAKAGHDGTNVLHLGAANIANGTTELVGDFAPATGTSPILHVFSEQGPIGLGAGSRIGTGIVGGSGGGPPDEPGALGIGVSGVANHDGIGVRGESLSAGGLLEDQDGAGPGVLGLSGSGFGVEGRSRSGPGVAGFSDTGPEPGGVFFSQGGPGIAGTGSGEHPGVIGRSEGNGPGGAFDSENGPGVVATSRDVGAVVGFSENGPGGSFSSNGGLGLRGFIQGSGGPGVLGAAPGEAPGVRALSAPFFGGEFPPDAGLALEVIGQSRFSTAGSATVPAGDNDIVVANSAVTAKSHITVTLISDPGPRQVGWVERQPGTGFTVHLTFAPPPQRPATDFTYLVVGMP